MSKSFIFLNNDVNILATSSDVDLTVTQDWKYLIHAYLRTDKEKSLVYVDIEGLFTYGEQLDPEKVYELAVFVAEEFDQNRFLFRYKDEWFSILLNDGENKLKYFPKAMVIPKIDLGNKPEEFPVFWYESNSFFDNVRSIKDLATAMRCQMGDSGGFNDLEHVLTHSRTVNDHFHKEFGTRMEHKGDYTLKQFLIDNALLDDLIEEMKK